MLTRFHRNGASFGAEPALKQLGGRGAVPEGQVISLAAELFELSGLPAQQPETHYTDFRIDNVRPEPDGAFVTACAPGLWAG